MAWLDFTQATIIPPAGDNTSSANPTGNATADLVSAATNVNGIIVTGASLAFTIQGTSVNGTPHLRLLAGGIIQLEAIIQRTMSDLIGVSIGGLGPIEIPAGQALSYSSSLGGTTSAFYGFVRVTWRHKA